MSLFTNKKVWQKLLIIFLIIILFQAVFMKPAHAVDADILLKPITGLFVGLADALEGVMQKIVLGINESLFEIKDGNTSFWANFIIIGLFIVGTALAIVTAIPSGGSSVGVWAAFAISAGAKIAISIGAYTLVGELLTTLTAEMLADTYYLPQYELSPYEIFADKITVLDIDFFNPKENKVVGDGTTVTSVSLGNLVIESGDTDYNGSTSKRYKVKSSDFDRRYGFGSYNTEGCDQLSWDTLYFQHDLNRAGSSTDSVVAGGTASQSNPAVKYSWKKDGKKYEAWIGNRYEENGTYYRQVMEMTVEEEATKTLKSPARELSTYIAGWYKTLRNLALVILLSILVYVGIRIMLSSVASDKAKYKQMLMDWVVAICLLFLMHYIMSFSVYIVKQITEMISSIQINDEQKGTWVGEMEANQSFGSQLSADAKKDFGMAVDVVVLNGTTGDKMQEKVKNAYNALAKSGDKETRYANFFYTDSTYERKASSADDAKVLVWPVSNFMEEARIRYQILRDDGSENLSMYGYGLIYVILVLYTIIFLFTYMKRVVYMAFLTVIAPLVAVTYPIDKMNDGKAQAFDMWFKEYIFNLLIQPLHLIMYSVLIGSAMSFATENLVYVVMALGFFVPAEKLLRRFFGFEKAQTPGMFAGAAGAALLHSGLNHLMHPRPPIGGPGGKGEKGGKGEIGSGDDEDGKPPRTTKIDEASGFLGDNNESNNDNITDEPDQFKFDVDDENDQNAQKYHEAATGQREALLGMQDATTEAERQEYNDLYNSYGKDIDGLRNPEYIKWRDGQNPWNANLSESTRPIRSIGNTRNIGNSGNTNNTNNSGKNKRPKGVIAGIKSYQRGMHKRYLAKKQQNGGMLKKGIRMAGGIATATVATAAAGVIGITSGDIGKAGQYMAAGAVGGYKLGSSLGNNIADRAKNQKEMIKEAKNEGKKARYGREEYEKREQEKYIKEFKKNEENLRKIQYKLNVNKEQAQNIMEDHAEDYVNNGITNMDEFIATYQLEHKEGMGRKKAIATRHYAMDRLGGKKVKELDPEAKEKYSNMFNQEFRKAGDSEIKANQDVSNLFDAVGKFHSYKK